MRFSKYILACGCLCGPCFATYAGDDSGLDEVREEIESLKSQIAELKAKDEDITEKNKTFDESLTAIKSQMTETDQKLDSISQKVEQQPESEGDNPELEELKQTVSDLQTAQQELAQQASSDELALENSEKIAKLEASISSITQDIQSQKSLNDQQALDLAKNEARVDKLERLNTTSSVANVAGGLLGTALQGGLNILSQKLNSNSIKESLIKGESTAEITKNMTPEEVADFERIKQGIAQGKSDQEVQAELDKLKNKIAIREDKASKFQEVVFYGIDPALKSTTTILHILNQARSGSKIDPNSILTSIEGSEKRNVEEAYINTIYDWGQKGANLKDVLANIKVIAGGSPKKVVKAELLQNSTPANSQFVQSSRAQMQNTAGSGLQNIISGATNFLGTGNPNIVSTDQMYGFENPQAGLGSDNPTNFAQQDVMYPIGQETIGINQDPEVSYDSVDYLNQTNPVDKNSANYLEQDNQALAGSQVPGTLNQGSKSQLGEQIQGTQQNASNYLNQPNPAGPENQIPNAAAHLNQTTQVGQGSQAQNMTMSSNQRSQAQLGAQVAENSQNSANYLGQGNRVSSITGALPQENKAQLGGQIQGTQQNASNYLNQPNPAGPGNQASNAVPHLNQNTQVGQGYQAQNMMTSLNQTDQVGQGYQVQTATTSSNQRSQAQLGTQGAENSQHSANYLNQGSQKQAENQLPNMMSGNAGTLDQSNIQMPSNTQTGAVNQAPRNLRNSVNPAGQVDQQIASSTEPDTFDMTLMDVMDNKYYDVTKKKFMRIARTSTKFPTTVTSQNNVKVRPIDARSAQRVTSVTR